MTAVADTAVPDIPNAHAAKMAAAFRSSKSLMPNSVAARSRIRAAATKSRHSAKSYELGSSKGRPSVLDAKTACAWARRVPQASDGPDSPRVMTAAERSADSKSTQFGAGITVDLVQDGTSGHQGQPRRLTSTPRHWKTILDQLEPAG